LQKDKIQQYTILSFSLFHHDFVLFISFKWRYVFKNEFITYFIDPQIFDVWFFYINFDHLYCLKYFKNMKAYPSHAGAIDPVRLVVCHRQMLGLSALLQWLCWKRNWGGSRRPLSQAERWSREHFFSGVVHPSNPFDDSWKVTTYRDHPQKAYAGHTWTGVGSVRVVLVGFSPVGCTSIWISVTLGYE
jgi:hypothetical protein